MKLADLLEEFDFANVKTRKGHNPLVRKSQRHDDRRKKSRAQQKQAHRREMGSYR